MVWTQVELDDYFSMIPHVYAAKYDPVDKELRYNRAYEYAMELLTKGGFDVNQATAILLKRLERRHVPKWTDAELRSVVEDARAFIITGKFSLNYILHNSAQAFSREYVLPATERINLAYSEPPSLAGNAVIQQLSEVQCEQVDWLWTGRVPLGGLTILAGDPDKGKSYVSLDWAARVSRGFDWPDGTPCVKGSVVLMSTEDSLSRTVRPRLDAAGADCSKIIALKSIYSPASDGSATERQVSLQRDLDSIAAAIEHVEDCKLVVIDPISAYWGDINTHKDTEIRNVLTPLNTLAEQHQIAVVIVGHLNKDKNGESSAMYRASGSVAIVAAARTFYLVTEDKKDATNSRRLMLTVKNNLSIDKTGLAYSIIPSGDNARVEWEPNPIDIRADEALAPTRPNEGRPVGAELARAVEWLRETLTTQSRLPGKEVERLAGEAGVSSNWLRKARASLGVVPEREGFGKGAVYYWMLPSVDSRHVDTPSHATSCLHDEHGEHGAEQMELALQPE